MVAPPVVNFCCGCCQGCYLVAGQGGGSCWNVSQGGFQWPGRGGASKNTCDGSAYYGGIGVGGMVCVQYTTAP